MYDRIASLGVVPLNETSQFNYYHSHFYFTFSLAIFFLYLCLCYLAEFAFILTISDEEKMNANSKNWSTLGGLRRSNILAASGVLVICKFQTQNFVNQVSVEYIAQ